MFNSIIILMIFGSVCELRARPCRYTNLLTRYQHDSATDSFVENSDKFGSINTNRNSPVQLDVNGVDTKMIRPVSATSDVEIPAISVIDQGHTGSDNFRISDGRDENDGFEDEDEDEDDRQNIAKLMATIVELIKAKVGIHGSDEQ